jgi:hypothetical protein
LNRLFHQAIGMAIGMLLLQPPAPLDALALGPL